MPQEYPSSQCGDFREPAYEVLTPDGASMSSLRYKSYKIVNGKPKLAGLPATYVQSDQEARTLYVELEDEAVGLVVTLIYSVFEKYNVISRSVKFCNKSNKKIRLNRALSCSVDFNSSDYKLLHLAGAWARERSIVIEELNPGIKSIQSKRGASSHQCNPFIALLDKNADEDHGQIFGFSFVYSGNFLAQVEVDQFDALRVQMGINPYGFSWLLEVGEEFQSPEVVMVYSCDGLGGMYRTYHDLYRENLCRGVYKKKTRPVLANSWEAMYFDFNSDDIVNFAKSASTLGIELVVMDDGWFGKRDQNLLARDVPTSSLGDWQVNLDKIPEGIDGLVKRAHEQGVGFGIWFEPEMVSPDSDLFRCHPDWCIQVKDRDMYLSRGQYVLDLSRKDVCDHIVDVVSEILNCGLISYVKWDMNRNMTNIGSVLLPPEIAHRYILGLYNVLERLTAAFPDVLFEGCSGGGGRFDAGVLYYMPQIWTSDNTDAVSRLAIQRGTSIVYPAITMGAHISSIPNHQTGRSIPSKFRADVAMMGNFGYELDLGKLTDDERSDIKKQIAYYKEIQHIVQFGDMHRLCEVAKPGLIAVEYISKDRQQVVVFVCRPAVTANSPNSKLKLKSLKPNMKYSLREKEQEFDSDYLMGIGLDVKLNSQDYSSCVLRLDAIG